jgi:wobble nucleotide-excising tRNase
LAKRGIADKTIVILDDVLGSVDQQHMGQTLDMLLGESKSFSQLIMTTHYRPLRDRFKFSHKPTAPVQLIELKPWNFEQGIRSGKTKLYVDELKQQLKEDDFRRDVIASQAGGTSPSFEHIH